MTIPTIGRIVHYYHNLHAQPQAALIAYVYSPTCVNAAVFGEDGTPVANPPTSLLLLQDGREPPGGGPYCCWPPAAKSTLQETAGRADCVDRGFHGAEGAD